MDHPFIQYLAERDIIPPGASEHLADSRCLLREPIGMIAVSHGLLQVPQIDAILDEQRDCSERFGEIAIRLGFMTPGQVETLVKIQQFRAAGGIAEALALAGILRYEDAIRYLGAYLTADQEILSVMADQ